MKKTILITGASSGIGKETARALAPDYEVIIHYNSNRENALKLKNELEEKYKRQFLAVKCNLASEEEIDSMLDIIYQKYDKIDILINNAAMAIDTIFEDKTKENFRKILDINLVAPFILSKKIGLRMKKNKYGVIINISSTNGIDTEYPESLDYDASKAGLISVSNNLANYLAPYVRVNTVCPGWVNTEMNSNLDKYFIHNEEEKILLNRFASPEEIANTVKFLISDAASYINKSVIRVDGGIRWLTNYYKMLPKN